MAIIYALSTAPGRAGISIFRFSGAGCHAVIDRFLQVPFAGAGVVRRQHVRLLIHPETGAVLDQVVVVLGQAPATFTGEDTVELHIHGSIALQRLLPELFDACPGVRQAEPGEFLRRSLLHGKRSVAEIEHLDALLQSETYAQLEVLGRRQLLYGAMQGWERDLIAIISTVEGALEFPDDEDGSFAEALLAAISGGLMGLLAEMRAVEASSARALRVLSGFRLVLIGRPNVGKSSTLNALLGEDVAIASAVPGTTRDVVERRVDLAGLLVCVSDTAGIHATGDALEREGVARARVAMRDADLLLCITDREESPAEFCAELGVGADARCIFVRNKADLLQAGTSGGDWLLYSAHRGDNHSELRTAIIGELQAVAPQAETVFVTRQRQLGALQESIGHLETAIGFPAGRLESELEVFAEELRLALYGMGAIIGRFDYEAILDDLFSNFCLGK